MLNILGGLLASDPDPRVKTAAADLLVKKGSKEALAAFERAVEKLGREADSAINEKLNELRERMPGRRRKPSKEARPGRKKKKVVSSQRPVRRGAMLEGYRCFRAPSNVQRTYDQEH